MPLDTIRLDKWLWYARQVKTRSKATKLVQEGRIRVNRERISKASHALHIGDNVTAMIGGRLKVLEVLALGTRRGPASEAALLYTDLSPEFAPAAGETPLTGEVPKRPRGSGRPTKRERRQTDQLRQRALFDAPAKTD